MLTCPASLEFCTPDTVAECYPVSSDTYNELWVAQAKMPKPPFQEYPEPLEEEFCMPGAWAFLSDDAKRDVIRAAYKEDGQE